MKISGRGWGGTIVGKLLGRFIVLLMNTIKIDSIKLYLDYTDGIDHIIRPYKKYQIKCCLDNISPNDVVVDIGANIGHFALVASKVGKAGHVFCFEASPHNCNLIKKNIKINNINTISVENKAVSNLSGFLKLYLYRETKYHRLYPTPGHQKFINIKAIKLDDFELPNKIDFIKIDVVGSEAKVIEGMRGIINNNPNLKIVMEFSASRVNESGASIDDMFHILESANFRIYDLDTSTQRVVSVDSETISKSNKTHYLLLKKS
jgi:FkbM family methyltransferase